MSVVKGNYDTMGVFMEKLNAYKNTKDKEQRKVMQREIIELYVEFAVPAVSLGKLRCHCLFRCDRFCVS